MHSRLSLHHSSFAIGIAMLLCGCSSTHEVRSASAMDSFTLERTNDDLRGAEVAIEMRDGSVIAGRDVTVTHDSLSWRDARDEGRSRTSLAEVRRIVRKDRARGALDGLELGLPIGGLVGALAGSALNIKGTAESGSQVGGFGALVGLVLGGGTGLIVGPVTGLVIGHRDVYEFPTHLAADSLSIRH